MWRKEIFHQVGNLFGKVVRVNNLTMARKRLDRGRVCIFVSGWVPIVSRVFITMREKIF